jgi:hypothetical protein
MINTPIRSEQEWASIIKADLGKAVENVISAGKNLALAYAQLGKGRYGHMLKLVGIKDQTAQRLVRIANNPILADPLNAPRLPPSMRTLSELARIEGPILEGYLKDGVINIETERSEVEELLKSGHKDGVENGGQAPSDEQVEAPPKRAKSGIPSRRMPAEPVVEAWAQPKPPADVAEAKQAANAIAEAEELSRRDLKVRDVWLTSENKDLKEENERLKAKLDPTAAAVARPLTLLDLLAQTIDVASSPGWPSNMSKADADEAAKLIVDLMEDLTALQRFVLQLGKKGATPNLPAELYRVPATAEDMLPAKPSKSAKAKTTREQRAALARAAPDLPAELPPAVEGKGKAKKPAAKQAAVNPFSDLADIMRLEGDEERAKAKGNGNGS